MWVAGEEVFKGQRWLLENCMNCILHEDRPALVVFGNALRFAT